MNLFGNFDLDLYGIVFLSFLVIYIVVTIVSGRKGTSLSEYYNMGGNAPIILVVGTYAATWISALGVVGDTGTAYASGTLPALLRWGAIPGFVLSAFMGLRLRRFGQVTLGDYFGDRYESSKIRVLTSLITSVGLLFYFFGQLIGTGVVFEQVLGIPYLTALVMMAIVYCIIVVVGGSKSNTITDTIMMGLISGALAFIFCPILINNVGLDAFAANRLVEPMRYTAMSDYWTPMTVVGNILIWMFGNACNPSAITRCYLVKDDRSWIKTMMIVFMLVISVIWLLYMGGAAIYLHEPNLVEIAGTAQAAFPWASKNISGPIIGGTAIAGLMGACLSTATTQVLTIGVSLTRDVLEKTSKKNYTEKQLLTYCRIIVVVVCFFSVIVSLSGGNFIVVLGNFGSAIFAACFAPALILGLFWKKMTKKAALYSMVTGFVLDAFFYFGGVVFGSGFGSSDWLPLGLHPAFLALVLGFIVAIVVSNMTQDTITEGQMAVFDMTAKPMDKASVKTSDASMKAMIIIFGCFIIAFVAITAYLYYRIYM